MAKKPKAEDRVAPGIGGDADTSPTESPKAGGDTVSGGSPQPATATDIGERMAEEMPAPSPNAVAEMSSENDASLNAPSDPQPAPLPEAPKRGRGRPPMTDDQKAANKAARKSKVGTVSKSATVANVAETSQEQTAAIAMAAGTATSLTIMLGCVIGGEDFAPGKNPLAGGMDDDKFLFKAYFDYCKAKGVQDIPPGVALSAALMVYVAPRLNKPNTKTRLQKVGGAIAHFWGKIRKRKTANAPHVIGRDDGERENDTRQAA